MKICDGTGKYNVCMPVCTLFNPEILQAGTVKGLRKHFITSSSTKFSFGSFLPAGDRPDVVVVVDKTCYEKVN